MALNDVLSSGNQYVGFPAPGSAAEPTEELLKNAGYFSGHPRQHERAECGFHHLSGIFCIF
jgi:hypothetical protein